MHRHSQTPIVVTPTNELVTNNSLARVVSNSLARVVSQLFSKQRHPSSNGRRRDSCRRHPGCVAQVTHVPGCETRRMVSTDGGLAQNKRPNHQVLLSPHCLGPHCRRADGWRRGLSTCRGQVLVLKREANGGLWPHGQPEGRQTPRPRWARRLETLSARCSHSEPDS